MKFLPVVNMFDATIQTAILNGQLKLQVGQWISCGGMYCNKIYTVNCTPEEFEAAKQWERDNTKETIPYNKYCYNRLGANTFLGCIVTLKGSRKAPNKTPLTVIKFHEAYFDKRYNQHVTEKVTVTDGVTSWDVSSNCIHELIKGVKEYVYWAE